MLQTNSSSQQNLALCDRCWNSVFGFLGFFLPLPLLSSHLFFLRFYFLDMWCAIVSLSPLLKELYVSEPPARISPGNLQKSKSSGVQGFLCQETSQLPGEAAAAAAAALSSSERRPRGPRLPLLSRCEGLTGVSTMVLFLLLTRFFRMPSFKIESSGCL